MIQITLPWPDKRLSPNTRLSWRAKLKPKREARDVGYTCARASCDLDSEPLTGKLHATYNLHPHNRRSYDADNVLSSLKSYIDGVCIGLGINDNQIVTTTVNKCGVFKGGKIIMILEEM